ncbi:MAG: InlB B-repeat-containing protein [Oscillospiraceae bacterium]|nr:InlB B-repeat-containing protein [Oscillospiraceae bacterium]
MKSKYSKRSITLIVTLVMLMSLALPVRLRANSYDPINMDLNDPNDPIEDTCWLQRGQPAYVLDEMRPIIVGTQKFVYTDPSYDEKYLITDAEYPVAYEDEIILWVKFVQTMWNGDTQSKYYYVIVHGPPSPDVVYMKSLAGEEINPESGKGTFEDTYKATIYVSESRTDITRSDIVRSSTSGVGYIFTSGDFLYFAQNVELKMGENHVYIVILNSDGYIAIYYDITVIRGPVKYLLTYYANNGTSANKEVEVFKDDRYEVAGNSFTPPTGYAFSGWNTAADGNGDDYEPGEEITIRGDVTLYAQWAPNQHTVTYKSNGGIGDDIPVNVAYDEEYKVANNNFAPPTGYAFSGWNTAANGSGNDYEPGEEITIRGDVTLYAQWAPHSHTVTYKANVGTQDDIVDNVLYNDEYKIEGNKFTAPKWYEFASWNTAADGSGNDYEPGEKITIRGDIILYAQWKPISPLKPIIETDRGERLVYLLWKNAGAGGADNYKVTYYETEDIGTSVTINLSLGDLTYYDAETSYYMFFGPGMKTGVDYSFEIQAVVTATGATSDVEYVIESPTYMGDPGGFNTDLVSVQDVIINPPPGGWPSNHGNTLIDPYEVTISLPRVIGSVIVHRDHIRVSDSASYTVYSDFGFTNKVELVNRLGTGITWFNEVYVYLMVTSANRQSIKYYRITVM